MIVASLTTHEPRAAFLAPTLDSILAQIGVERVVLNVHEACVPLLRGVPCDPKVEVHVVEDIGPGKKHLAPLVCRPDDVIVTFDDDHIYRDDHTVHLVAEVIEHERVASYRGYRIDDWSPVKEGPAHALDGKTSWAYRAGWLDPQEVLRLGRRSDCWHSDDVYVGALFYRAGRQCWVATGHDQRHVWPTPNIDAYHASGLQFVEQEVRDQRNRESRAASWPADLFVPQGQHGPEPVEEGR